MSEKTKQWIKISCIVGGVLLAGGIALFIYITSVPKERVSILSNPILVEDVQSIEVFVTDSQDVDQEQKKVIADAEGIKRFVESANAAVMDESVKVEDSDLTITASYIFVMEEGDVELLSLVSDETVMMTSEGWMKVDFNGLPTLYECFEASEAEEIVVDASGNEVYEATRKVIETEMETLLHGVDVSQHQGNINWDEVAAEGIDFAIIRVGNRNVVSGEIEEDITARYNLQEATSRGIPVGAYFFSAATTEEEAMEEANFVTAIIDGYPITYPVAYNCELYDESDSRHFSLSVEQRSQLADVFLSEIENQGYTGMFYASQFELEGNAKWNTDLLEAKYRIWVAQYKDISEIDLEGDTSDYGEDHELWQYTANGSINGISMPVDMNVSYIGYREVAVAKSPETAVHQEPNLEVGVNIEEVNDSVTAKERVNVRSSMEQTDDSNIIGALQNGEIVTRTGIGVNGWSRIEYNGESAYVVSSYITPDTDYVPQQGDMSQFKTKFTTVNEQVTAKELTNLRDMPSVEEPSQIIVSLKNGEVATRTGVANEGWSRVEYQGQVLYCVSSYLQIVN